MSFASTRTIAQDYVTLAAPASEPSVSADAVLRLAGKAMVLFLCGAAPWVAILKVCALL